MAEAKVGDLLWTRIAGHPPWPAQVMDTRLINKTVRRAQRVGTTCVLFLGDNSFGWLEPDAMSPFDQGYDEKVKSKAGNKAKVSGRKRGWGACSAQGRGAVVERLHKYGRP